MHTKLTKWINQYVLNTRLQLEFGYAPFVTNSYAFDTMLLYVTQLIHVHFFPQNTIYLVIFNFNLETKGKD